MHLVRRLNIPLILTLTRLAIAPLLLPFLIYYLFPSQSFITHIILASLCAFVCLTDFLDGYLARKYSQVTSLGKLLDPIADKLFMSAMFITLVAVQKFYFMWAILLIGREFAMNGLRAFAAQQRHIVNVSMLGRLKTTFQGILLVVIILNPYRWIGVYGGYLWTLLEVLLLVATMFFSFYSAFKYYQNTLEKLKTLA
ncbi:CDP-diacylglycerol--glycerol-3-phosphate 3-phosphatidyltransferase [bacterium]|jgi:CDP-diacylglycerol--glycerol-3-phosphate 3-phosphatidyltransferase|nr:CDP-diacylglycerol--glycerol-3-phosphate 3-phosphatidyltransferase [bacterium]MBT5014853.1 CDP-diacylglycerol--glycerol-3-phosphate 3-phosphatidyltransferase [bacterium]